MLRTNRLARTGALFAAVIGLLATGANADPLPSGATIAPRGITLSARPSLAGTVLADERRPFSAGAGANRISGWLQDRVVRSTATGRLHFYYRIIVDPSAVSAAKVAMTGVFMVRRPDFAPTRAVLDANWRIDGLGTVAPISMRRVETAAGVTSLAFEYDHLVPSNFIHPGESSRFVLVETEATDFRAGGRTVLNLMGLKGAPSVELPSFLPVY